MLQVREASPSCRAAGYATADRACSWSPPCEAHSTATTGDGDDEAFSVFLDVRCSRGTKRIRVQKSCDAFTVCERVHVRPDGGSSVSWLLNEMMK